ncbi:GspL periplasmic domain protein [Stieleria maiorica]|uniref:GspL periplasmic domain protein n=1 Tax=Stieleria maiorica TaxID=2795974 RepID=A0A5B9MPK8_9BACT|nr:type II secretion system protein GspL [Stieleria maiorica]QEG02834.1 GspL periplasmic domain protein [Stieleria maiorica]
MTGSAEDDAAERDEAQSDEARSRQATPMNPHGSGRASESSTDRFCIDGGGLLAQTESGWFLQVGAEPVELDAESSPEVAAASFARLCDDVRGAEKRCVLGLPAGECFFVYDDLPAGIDAKDRDAVTFELERHFPLDAESMVADYFVRPSAGQIAAIAIETRRHRKMVDALEAAGIDVVAILPTTFLVARTLQRGRPTASPYTALILGDAASESVSVDADGVYQWRKFCGGDDELARHQAVVAEPSESSQTTIVLGRSELTFQPVGQVERCDRDVIQLAAEGAGLVLGGRWGRWPDLRRGDLAPSDPLRAVAAPLRRLAIAAACCLMVLLIASWYRGGRLAERSESLRQQQRALFAESFPQRRVPVLLMRTVRNEHRKTLGSRGRGDAIRLPVAATTVLRELYRGLRHAQQVGAARFRVIDVKIVDGDCSLTVRAVDAVQIGTIAQSLETVGFQVAPPASDQIDPSKDEPIPTYQSTLSAVWKPTPIDADEGVDS